MSNVTAPTDLSKRPPRSTRTRLGGYVLLPRIIDKCRAVIAGTRRSPHEIHLWSRYMEDRAPSGVEMREHFNQTHKDIAPDRDDIATWFDWLDLDDYASYGGKV